MNAEWKTNWKEADEDDIIALAHRLGPDFTLGGENIKLRIYELDERR